MQPMAKTSFGLADDVRDKLARRFRKPQRAEAGEGGIAEALCRFDRHPGYEKLLAIQAVGEKLGLPNPFFRTHDGVAGAGTRIDGRGYVNFANYDYLGLNGHPSVSEAAHAAIERYGTSVSAARLGGGERAVHAELERALAELYEVDESIVMVSGHATNVTTIGYLFGPRDLILYDRLAHNSILEGVRLSGAAHRAFAHNDAGAADAILREGRRSFERVLIVIEGLYSMDGDVADLPAFVEVKKRHKAFLMVDEAHALGVLGATGRGLGEHHGLDGREVDLWMGTLSKSLAGCGGFIAGERALVEHLRYAAPGFVYSVGLPPALAAASLQALRVMLEEPQRVARLRRLSRRFAELAASRGVDTGRSQGFAIVPAMLGPSIAAVSAAARLFDEGINVQPVVYPGVEEGAARLRFFINCTHEEAQLDAAVDALVRAGARA